MTPESNTIFSLSLMFALVSLLYWLHHRHRITMRVRQGVALALRTCARPPQIRLIYRPGFDSSRSARNQSSHGEPSMFPRISQ